MLFMYTISREAELRAIDQLVSLAAGEMPASLSNQSSTELDTETESLARKRPPTVVTVAAEPQQHTAAHPGAPAD